MAEKKTTAKSASRQAAESSAKTQKKQTPAAKKAAPQRVQSSERGGDPTRMIHQLLPYILGFVALFIGICLISDTATGLVGSFVRMFLYGMFSGAAVLVPFMTLNIAVFWKKDIEKGSVRYKLIFSLICLSFVAVLIYNFTRVSELYSLKDFWYNGQQWSGGGVIGGSLGWLLFKAVGSVGTVIVSVAMLLIFGIFLFGLTPHAVWVYIAYAIHQAKERRAERMAEGTEPPRIRRAKPKAEDEPVEVMPPQTKRKFPSLEEVTPPEDAILPEEAMPPETEVDIVDVVDIPEIDTAVFDEVMRQQEAEAAGTDDAPESIKPEKPRREKAFADIFADEPPLSEEILRKFIDKTDSAARDEEKRAADAAETELTVERVPVTNSAAEQTMASVEEVKPEPEYVFPPLTLLTQGTPPANTDVADELQTTAKKLVETLANFKVRTKIVHVSRGPTITRYELAPEEGVRVRSIVNLVDDIALNLATTGVRIEAPIPGKQAVGIEVPNRVVATVYLRTMIDNAKFTAAPSRITVSLGEDVAGEPIYVDIAKMPHLMIAGATGMGKSVCINSMIVSMLYKASPEEVKLILIDPKKVELNIYNGLPHLLVPVVSDPKKAAGSLQWAVTEMERRFTLIEEVGMRDLKGYNNATRNDPEKEFLPQIVIIIDELADLMMTAKDDVEESICRLAQKARAAGMHLIVGTQRPSVDVITGLIKANIPSRIAFTVASQVDSRTILDITGAEKLIGRGDMLYAPVGSAKPVRVQGAYVSEQDVETIIEFIKSHYGASEYDAEVIDRIEREAERCGTGKKGAAAAMDDDGDDNRDPMLKPAIELAVESGKISTSLLQRTFSIGYGRAAKLIDRMEELGYVGPLQGQKPRAVLLTRQQYMEMVLNKEEIE